MSLSKEAKFANESLIGMKWRVKEDVLKVALEEDEHVFSEIYPASNIPGVVYYLALHLDYENSDKVNVILQIEFEMAMTINAMCTVSVKSASYSDIFWEAYGGSEGYPETLCTRDELFKPESKFFVNGFMEIELAGTLKSPGIQQKLPTSSSTLVNILWKNDREKDITIVASEQEIKIHKWVLSAKSSLFKAEMESGLKESTENRIEIKDFCFETVKIAVEYFYERDINDQINDENASELLHFSDKYDVEPLHNLVQNLLIDKLSEENVVQFANMSITSNAYDLRDCCICFLMTLTGKLNFIKNVTDLDKEFFEAIGRRSIYGICE